MLRRDSAAWSSGLARPSAHLHFLCLLVSALCAGHARAADAGLSGYANTLSSQPPTADSATLSRTGSEADVYDVDTDDIELRRPGASGFYRLSPAW